MNDYSKFLDRYTPMEAAYLAYDLKPLKPSYSDEGWSTRTKDHDEKADELQVAIERAVETGSLDKIDVNLAQDYPEGYEYYVPYYIDEAKLKIWFRSKGLEPRFLEHVETVATDSNHKIHPEASPRLPDPKFFSVEMLANRWNISTDEVMNRGVSHQIKIGAIKGSDIGIEPLDIADLVRVFTDYNGEIKYQYILKSPDIQYDPETSYPYPDQDFRKKRILLDELRIPFSDIRKLEAGNEQAAKEDGKQIEVNSLTYLNLIKAIGQFPEKYPNHKTKAITKENVQDWLKDDIKLASNDREKIVFAKILQEHYKFSSEMNKTQSPDSIIK